MKALILAGGRGRRIDDVSSAVNKCMIRVHGKRLIEYSLDCAATADVSDIVIIVGYRAEDIINTFGIEYRGKRIAYVIQPEQRGVVHAIECARGALGKDDFMLLLGDEWMLNPRHADMMRTFNDENLFGICGIVAVGDRALIRKTYSVIQDESGRIFRLVEKPQNPMNDWMGTGNCIFRNHLLDYIDQTPINQKRGEKELPDLIQCAIDEGRVIKSFILCDRYVNINSMDELKAAEAGFFHF